MRFFDPQSAKQDNQATTILKEVAGAARTALGSTIVQYVCFHPINTHLTTTRTKCI
jgi:hypothetical protein